MQDKLSGFGQNLYLKVYKALIAYIIEQISLQPFTIISTAASTARVLAIPSIDREPFYPTNRCCPPCCGAIHLLHSFFHRKYRPRHLQCFLCHTFRHIFFLLVTCGVAAVGRISPVFCDCHFAILLKLKYLFGIFSEQIQLNRGFLKFVMMFYALTFPERRFHIDSAKLY